MLRFQLTKRTDYRLLERMKNHYSQPKGFVGRNLCYAIFWDNAYFGHIVGGSATRFLPGRNEYLGMDISKLNNVINNIFYNISLPKNYEKYPKRNFTSLVLKSWMPSITNDWEEKYGDTVIGFESLVEKPRTGELYLKAGFTIVGETIGYTCKRIGSTDSTDGWSGKRVWNTDKNSLKPKLVLVKKLIS